MGVTDAAGEVFAERTLGGFRPGRTVEQSGTTSLTVTDLRSENLAAPFPRFADEWRPSESPDISGLVGSNLFNSRQRLAPEKRMSGFYSS